MIVKTIFSFSCYSSLYTAFTILIAYRGLDTVLVTTKYIKIIISGIIVVIVVTFIHQSESSSDSNLNFTLTIQSILLFLLIVEIIYKFVNLFGFQLGGSLILFRLK